MSDSTVCHGRFVWHEIVTPDVDASKRFYGELLPWNIIPLDVNGVNYHLVAPQGADAPIGGIMPLSQMSHSPGPCWLASVSVIDVDEAARAATQAGGKVPYGPRDLPGIGRLAGILDPHGGHTTAFRSAQPDPPEVTKPLVGSFCWDQLNTPSPGASAAFYAKVYGWTAHPFPGTEGTQVLRRADRDAASMMQAPPSASGHWLSYVLVENLSRSREKALTLGGKIHVEHIEVPGMGAFCVIADNVGITVALFESA